MKILYYIGAFTWALIAAILFGTSIFNITTLDLFFAFIIYGLLFVFFSYRCFFNILVIKDDLKISKEVIVYRDVPVEETKETKFKQAYNLVTDDLNYIQTFDFPNLYEQFKYCLNYLNLFKNRKNKISSYILDSIILIAKEYKPLVTTDIRDTPKGQELIEQITEILTSLNIALGENYQAIIEGRSISDDPRLNQIKNAIYQSPSLNNLNNFAEANYEARYNPSYEN